MPSQDKRLFHRLPCFAVFTTVVKWSHDFFVHVFLSGLTLVAHILLNMQLLEKHVSIGKSNWLLISSEPYDSCDFDGWNHVSIPIANIKVVINSVLSRHSPDTETHCHICEVAFCPHGKSTVSPIFILVSQPPEGNNNNNNNAIYTIIQCIFFFNLQFVCIALI